MLNVLSTLRWQDILDIAIVATVLYWLFLILKGTRALQMLVGLALLLLASLISKSAELYTVDWLVTSFWAQVVLVIVILFQPEIRRALAQIGQTPFSHTLTAREESSTLEEIIRAVVSMANKRTGAMIVLERETELKDIVEVGVALDAKLSKELLLSLFMPYSPLHDGAVIIKGDRLVAAGCFLPLTLNPEVSKMLGTRHRAALGVTEETDAVVIVVSEESGSISVIRGGKMTPELDATALRRILTTTFLREQGKHSAIVQRLKRLFPVRSK
ncbi:MAG: TIGR00159 family protein [Nitrospirae bacterium]|nr:TIGR00159 family protein [Nitrospirota bacterium]